MPPEVPADDEPQTAPLERRVPGETDISVFTTAVERAGRHRPDPFRLRVVWDGPGGRPLLRALAPPQGERGAAGSPWPMRPR